MYNSNSTQDDIILPRIENQDHNFIGNSIDKMQCSCGSNCEDKRRTKIQKSERCKRKLSNSISCDKQIKPPFSERPNLLIKYNEGREKSSLTLRNVCFDLLKLKSINLHNKFVSFCCYNNTNNKTRASITTSQHIRGSKSDSNNVRRRRRRQGIQGRGVVSVIMQLCLFLLSCLSILSYVESFQSNCPTICTCKWKNGKNLFFYPFFTKYYTYDIYLYMKIIFLRRNIITIMVCLRNLW